VELRHVIVGALALGLHHAALVGDAVGTHDRARGVFRWAAAGMVYMTASTTIAQVDNAA